MSISPPPMNNLPEYDEDDKDYDEDYERDKEDDDVADDDDFAGWV